MGQRQRDWAKRTRLRLRRHLGLCCWGCGSRDYRKLQFDCLKPCGDKHHKQEWSWRMSFYRQQLSLNNLGLLCEKCNAKKGDSTDFKMIFRPQRMLALAAI